MKTWLQLKTVLDKNCISESDQKIVRDFLLSFSFLERQTLLGILIGFEEKIEFFVKLIKYKSELKKSPKKQVVDELLALEKKEFNILFEDLKA
jgi:hypothetical protein